jgi:hypothetical protein
MVTRMQTAMANKRRWLPFAGAFAFMLAMLPAGPILTWVFLFAALGLILDGVMAIWPRGDKATEYKQ